MKKIIILLCCILGFGNINIANAASYDTSNDIEYLEDGSCFITTIETTITPPAVNILSASSTRSGKKQ